VDTSATDSRTIPRPLVSSWHTFLEKLMKNFVYFIGWLLKRMFGGVIDIYYKYDKLVVKEPWLGLLPTLMISVVVLFVAMLVFVSIDFISHASLKLSFGIAGLVYVNYFRILLREQYGKYMQERDKFVDTLKGSNDSPH